MKKIFLLLMVFFSALASFSQDKLIRYSSGVKNSPWGIASGEKWAGEYPKFNPMLRQAGVTWLRYFPEWDSIQPAYKKWNWRESDPFVVNGRKNNIQISGVFAYFAKWASADGGTRKCPVNNMQFWRDYVKGVTTRYKDDINSWEVWNEFNGSFAQNGTPKIYADMVKEAYITAKKVDTKIKIGMNCANFDVDFIDAAIKAGAANHFDFIAIQPFKNLESVMKDGGESGFLNMAETLRKMLKKNKQSDKIELWITEIGYQAPITPNSKEDQLQAEALVKAYILSLAQGFKRICWYEARGPAHKQGFDYGLIRKDWTPRPAFYALKTMISLLGKDPIYLGWLKTGTGGYGFVFQGRYSTVLVAWSPPNSINKIIFSSSVKMIDISGRETIIKSKQPLLLNRVPVFIYDLPKKQIGLAKNNMRKPFPWKIDYRKIPEVSCLLGVNNVDIGIKQIKQQTTIAVHKTAESWRKTNFKLGKDGRYIYFRVESAFASAASENLEITVIGKRVNHKEKTSVSLYYESLSGYKPANEIFNIPAGNQWSAYTWKVNDANFVGGWGWNFRIDANTSPGEIAVKEVRVKRVE
jgi:glycosyl hydrolase family 10